MRIGVRRLRVLAYVTAGPGSREVLVFEHVDLPEAGVQVPAGGVEPGETLTEAVAREVREECGVEVLGTPLALGVQDRPHPITDEPRLTVCFAAHAKFFSRQWMHAPAGGGDENGLRFRCAVRAVRPEQLADGQGEFLTAGLRANHSG